jgi:iron(III) transport system substrate-binding protein
MRRRANILLLLVALLIAGCGESARVVVLYTSQDQVYAEPLIAEFTKQTGIKVLPVFDSESVKTAGLVQRLIAEKNHPVADVFWSNEEMLARQLIARGVLNSNYVAHVGERTRRIVINTNKVSAGEAPRTVSELADPKWRGKVAMAYPVYGTTAAHMARLREAWGDEKWKQWCEKFAANKPFIVDGNSVVVKLVGAGEAFIGVTDSDDVAAGLRNKLPIAALPIDPKFNDEYLRIPNTIGIVTGAEDKKAALEFYEFAQSEKALAALVAVNALENVHGGSSISISRPIEETTAIVASIFKRQ